MTFSDLIFKQITPTNTGARLEFTNHYGISVITGESSLYDIAIIYKGEVIDKFFKCDTKEDITEIIKQIEKL